VYLIPKIFYDPYLTIRIDPNRICIWILHVSQQGFIYLQFFKHHMYKNARKHYGRPKGDNICRQLFVLSLLSHSLLMYTFLGPGFLSIKNNTASDPWSTDIFSFCMEYLQYICILAPEITNILYVFYLCSYFNSLGQYHE
jgi:hypothetical protein